MTISEIIEQLEDIKNTHGNIDCVIEAFDIDNGFEIMPVCQISVAKRQVTTITARREDLKPMKCALFLI